MAVAASWWTSGTFWSAVIALAVGLLGAAIAWIGPRRGRRRLHYGTISETRLLPRHGLSEEVRSNLVLLHRGQPVGGDPYVVEIVLRGMGNRDIPSSSFDQGKPLRIHLGVPIIEQLQVNEDSKSAIPTPPIRAGDKSVEIGPGLVGRRQRISVSLLVDGRPHLRAESPLPDIAVIKVDSPDATPSAIPKYIKYLAIAFVLFYLLSQPSNAAAVINNVFVLLGDSGDALAKWINSLGK